MHLDMYEYSQTMSAEKSVTAIAAAAAASTNGNGIINGISQFYCYSCL